MIAARVADRAGAASELIDMSVYASGRALRLLGSAKLAGRHRAPLLLNEERSAAQLPAAQQFAALVAGTLVVPGPTKHAIACGASEKCKGRPRTRNAARSEERV